MTDQTIPADKVRDIIARYRDGASHRGGMILDDLKALLPPPPLPTLADMIAGMREEWGIVTTYLGRHEVEEWGYDTREHAESDARLELNPTRIVRRYVTTPEEA